MNRFNKFLPITFMSAALLLTSAGHAMEIRQFDKMDDRDQAEYVGLLVQGAEKVLIDDGRTDLATQVHQLFTTTPSGDKMSLGMSAFEVNLARVRLVDAKNAEKNPDAPRFEVEHAMILTLKNKGIVLPKSFMTVNKDFKPKHAQDKKN